MSKDVKLLVINFDDSTQQKCPWDQGEEFLFLL